MSKIVSMQARPSKRILALVIDYFLIIIAFASPLLRLFDTTSLHNLQAAPPGLLIYVSSGLSLLAILYFAFFESVLGKTPGMQLTGLSTKASFYQSVVRNIFVLPIFPFIILLPFELYNIFRKKQLLLERFTNTKTIEQVIV